MPMYSILPLAMEKKHDYPCIRHNAPLLILANSNVGYIHVWRGIFVFLPATAAKLNMGEASPYCILGMICMLITPVNFMYMFQER